MNESCYYRFTDIKTGVQDKVWRAILLSFYNEANYINEYADVEEYVLDKFGGIVCMSENHAYYDGILFKTEKDKLWFLLNI